MHSITPLTNAEDEASPIVNGAISAASSPIPSAAPNNDLLVVYSAGPVNALNRPVNLPAPDAGLYLIPGGNPVNAVGDLTLIKNDPNYNEVWPRAVVSYRQCMASPSRASSRGCPMMARSHTRLPAGTPYGLVGTSSFYKRESFPGYASR